MRIAIVVLVVVAAAFIYAGVLGFGRTGDKSCDRPPSLDDGSADSENASCPPPAWANWFARLTSPFAPKLKIDDPDVQVPTAATVLRSVPESTSRMRVAHLELTDGQGMRVEYDCENKEQRICPETLCLCADGASFAALALVGCPAKWSSQRLAPNRCTSDDSRATLAIYPEASSITFSPLGPSGAAVRVK